MERQCILVRVSARGGRGGGVEGRGDTYISQLSAYIDFSQSLQCIIFLPGEGGGGVEEPFHVLVAYPNSIT